MLTSKNKEQAKEAPMLIYKIKILEAGSSKAMLSARSKEFGAINHYGLIPVTPFIKKMLNGHSCKYFYGRVNRKGGLELKKEVQGQRW